MKYITAFLLAAFLGVVSAEQKSLINTTDTEYNPLGVRLTVTEGLSSTDAFKNGRGLSAALTYKYDDDLQLTAGYVREKLNAKDSGIDTMQLDAFYIGAEYSIYSNEHISTGLSAEVGRARQGTSDIATAGNPMTVDIAYRGGADIYKSIGAFLKYNVEDGTYLIAAFKHRDYGSVKGYGGVYTPDLKDDRMKTNSVEFGVGFEF